MRDEMVAARNLRFAFDLGTNSIGWAVYELDRQPRAAVPSASTVGLVASGVRLFDDGRNPKDGSSLAEMRRVPRSSRRRRDRFVVRRATLINQLTALGLLPGDRQKRQALALLDPYRLRAEGLDRRLNLHEIGRALLHINQRRGFLSNRRADRKGKADEKGKIAQGVAHLQEQLAAAGARTFGEFLWKRHGGSDGTASPRTRGAVRIRLDGEGATANYEFYPSRHMLMAEFDALLAAQAQYHPKVLTAEVVGEIRETIFHQRQLKPVEPGRCTFVPDEPRLPKALPSVEVRVIYEALNNLRFGDGVTMQERLTLEQRDPVASVLLQGNNFTFRKLRSQFKIGDDKRISLEEAGKSDLKDYVARSAALGKDGMFGPKWFRMPLAERDAIVQFLIDTDDEAALVAQLTSEHGLTDEQARSVAQWQPRDGYARIGATANARILSELQSNDMPVYAEAVRRAGWHHSDERDGAIELPLPYYGRVLERHVLFGTGKPEDAEERRYGRFPNPTAHIALNQLRRVVNAMTRRFGEPSQIVLELARELKMNLEQKREADKRNKENRTVKDRHRALLAEHRQLESGDNFLRLRLFEEQERAGGGIAKCPFSLKPISVKQLFSSEVEIEHLLPYSRTFDDSAANKVVCFRAENRLKRSKSPHEAFGTFPSWNNIAAAAIGLPRNKRWRFAPDAMERFEMSERDFLSRQLNETRHLSRMARAYLSKACDPDQVYVTTGQLTAMLRARWGLNSIFRDHNRQPLDEGAAAPGKSQKSRDDHRHHAVDACVIGAIDRALLQEMAKRAHSAEVEDREHITRDVPEPFSGFRDAVRASIDKVVVSLKPEHGRGGALHEDTAYGLVGDPAEAAIIGNLVYRKPLVDLKPGEIDSVRDPVLRKELQAIAAPFRDAKGKVSKDSEKALSAALEKFAAERAPGREQGVRRVRIGKEKKGEVHIRNRQTGAVYKALIPGENHHIDIVHMRDGSWQGFAATVFEVNQKGWRPEWEARKLGGKLVMRLHKGDTIEVDDPDGQRRIKTVHRIEISANRIRLASHNEGGKLADRHDEKDDPFRWDFANIPGLKGRNARKVNIDALGAVRDCRSNVT